MKFIEIYLLSIKLKNLAKFLKQNVKIAVKLRNNFFVNKDL